MEPKSVEKQQSKEHAAIDQYTDFYFILSIFSILYKTKSFSEALINSVLMISKQAYENVTIFFRLNPRRHGVVN